MPVTLVHQGLFLVQKQIHRGVLQQQHSAGKITLEEYTLLNSLTDHVLSQMVAAFTHDLSDPRCEFFGLGCYEHDAFTRYGDERAVVFTRLEDINRARFDARRRPTPGNGGQRARRSSMDGEPTIHFRTGKSRFGGFDTGPDGTINFRQTGMEE